MHELAWPSPNYKWFTLIICNGCVIPSGNAHPSGHLVPSLFGTYLCSNYWDQIPRTFHVFTRLFTYYTPWYFINFAYILWLHITPNLKFVPTPSKWRLCFILCVELIEQKRSTEWCSKFKSPETRQNQERLVSTLEHMQVPKWERTRCPEEKPSSDDMPHPLHMFYGNLELLSEKSNSLIRSRSVRQKLV